MKKKIIILACTGLMSVLSINAQNVKGHELSIFGDYGLSTLSYNSTLGDIKNGLGGSFGLDYVYYFSKNFGLGTGFGISFYNAKSQIDRMDIGYRSRDFEGNDFVFRSVITDYEEKQKTMMFKIPVMFRYRTSNDMFYAGIGVKLGIPVNSTFKAKNINLKNTGFYEYENVEYDSPEFLGFGNFKRDSDGDIDFKLACIVSAEFGMKWKLSENIAVKTGVYIDYGVNNIYKEKSGNMFVSYNSLSPEKFVCKSIMDSRYTGTEGVAIDFVDKVIPIAAGVKFTLVFDLSK